MDGYQLSFSTISTFVSLSFRDDSSIIVKPSYPVIACDDLFSGRKEARKNFTAACSTTWSLLCFYARICSEIQLFLCSRRHLSSLFVSSLRFVGHSLDSFAVFMEELLCKQKSSSFTSPQTREAWWECLINSHRHVQRLFCLSDSMYAKRTKPQPSRSKINFKFSLLLVDFFSISSLVLVFRSARDFHRNSRSAPCETRTKGRTEAIGSLLTALIIAP